MFMLRSKRTVLSRKLLKAANGRASLRPAEGLHDELGPLLKRLKDNQLEMLLEAVETRGQRLDKSSCVLVPKEDRIDAEGFSLEPQVICCRAWRWPDLRSAKEMKRLPVCKSAADPVYVCCNPFHWSRLLQPDCPPPPYSRCAMDRIRPEDRAPSEAALVCRDSFPGSLTTSGGESKTNPLEWCKLAYWEMGERVGPQFPVDVPAVNVFGQVPYGDGLSLETLAQHSFSPPDSVYRTRCKIGLGVTLSREGGSVWVYNRSESPIFVNSLSLEDDNIEAPFTPTRVPAEHCLCVYDPDKAARYNIEWFQKSFGPIDPNSIRISFVKGWGPRYSRQEIKSCPCWLEILLAPCR